jgi:alkanesulfonate monooxygenase
MSTAQRGELQVVDALLDYYDVGIDKFLFRGFDPLEDAVDYGRNLLPALREAVAKRRPLARTGSEP